MSAPYTTSAVAKQLYAGKARTIRCTQSGMTAAEIRDLAKKCQYDQDRFQQEFRAIAEMNEAPGQCDGACVQFLCRLAQTSSVVH